MKKQGTKELWRACFSDTEEFIRLYFDEVYQEENTLVVEMNGRIVSALQLLPYSMRVDGKEIPVAYICGVSTHPDERGKGHMNRLMKEADDLLRTRNIPLATLIPAKPWLFNVYRKQGYTEAFFYSTESYVPSPRPHEHNYQVHAASATTPGLYPYFEKKLKERRACVLHTEADFRVILKDLELEDGKVFAAKNTEGDISGIALALPGNNEDALIKELLFNDDQAKEALLHSAVQYYNAKKAFCTMPPDSGEAHPKGMAKVIDGDYLRKANIDIKALFAEKKACMTLMLD